MTASQPMTPIGDVPASRPEPLDTWATCRRCRESFALRTLVGPLTGAPYAERKAYCDACEAAIQEEEAERERKAQAEARDRRREDAMRELDPPAEFQGLTLQSLRMWGSARQQERIGRALQIARRIVSETTHHLHPPAFVVFAGRPGNGKTMLAWAIASELAAQGRRTRVIRLSALIRDLRSSWGAKATVNEEQRLKFWISLDFLAIDEVTQDALYGNPRQHLIELISERIDRHKTTVITTNDSTDVLEQLLGWQLMSRLALGGRLHFGDDEDYRQLPSDERML